MSSHAFACIPTLTSGFRSSSFSWASKASRDSRWTAPGSSFSASLTDNDSQPKEENATAGSEPSAVSEWEEAVRCQWYVSRDESPSPTVSLDVQALPGATCATTSRREAGRSTSKASSATTPDRSKEWDSEMFGASGWCEVVVTTRYSRVSVGARPKMRTDLTRTSW